MVRVFPLMVTDVSAGGLRGAFFPPPGICIWANPSVEAAAIKRTDVRTRFMLSDVSFPASITRRWRSGAGMRIIDLSL